MSVTEVAGQGDQTSRLAMFVEQAARNTAPIVLTGEVGTGKEHSARSIHAASSRRAAPFLMVDCALYYERELKRELFGYVAGGSAGKSRRGLLEFATKGTCYLSHVEELTASIQRDLREFLKTGRFVRLGDGKKVGSGARVIISSEKNLQGFVAAGLFDSDLFELVSCLAFHLAPLRERSAEIPALVAQLVGGRTQSQRPGGLSGIQIEPEAVEALKAYPWPDNIDGLERELTRLIEKGHRSVLLESLSSDVASFWRGQSGDPEVRAVIEELESYIREFKVLCRIHREVGEEEPEWFGSAQKQGSWLRTHMEEA